MAVTAVYAELSRIPEGDTQRNSDAVSFSNISATTASFYLLGGKYSFKVIGSLFGTITLQVLAADNSTWVNVSSALAANTYTTFDLATGFYRIALA